MAATWTLKFGATTQSFEDWGILSDSIVRTLVNQGIDTLTFTQHLDIDVAQSFNYGDIVSVQRGGIGYFYGVVTKSIVSGNPSGETVSYEVSGPWWFLENIVFQDYWFVLVPPATAPSAQLRSRAILCQELTGETVGGALKSRRFSTGQQIVNAVTYAVAKGAQFIPGSIIAGIMVPFSEVVDVSCAEVVRSMLRWTPQVVTAFDYTGELPVLNVVDRGAGGSITKSLSTTADGITSFEASSREDLQVNGVKVIYEITNSLDDKTWMTQVVDQVGSEGVGGMVLTIQLSGGSSAFQYQYVKSDAVDARSANWWRGKLAWLANSKVAGPDGAGSPIFTDAKISPKIGFFDYDGLEVVEGETPNWLKEKSVRCVATAKVSYSVRSDNGAVETRMDDIISANFTGTSLGTGTYRQLVSDSPAEDIPPGLASSVFNSLATLHWEGAMVIEEDEVSADFRLDKTLNVTGGKTAWATMNAVIQQVSEDVGEGRTTVRFGPPQHLSPQDFIELARIHRTEKTSWRLQERMTGLATSGGAQVGGSVLGPNESASVPGSGSKAQTYADRVATNPSKIIVSTDDILAAVRAMAGDRDVRLREWNVCVDGVAKRAQFLSSLPY